MNTKLPEPRKTLARQARDYRRIMWRARYYLGTTNETYMVRHYRELNDWNTAAYVASRKAWWTVVEMMRDVR